MNQHSWVTLIPSRKISRNLESLKCEFISAFPNGGNIVEIFQPQFLGRRIIQFGRMVRKKKRHCVTIFIANHFTSFFLALNVALSRFSQKNKTDIFCRRVVARFLNHLYSLPLYDRNSVQNYYISFTSILYYLYGINLQRVRIPTIILIFSVLFVCFSPRFLGKRY